MEAVRLAKRAIEASKDDPDTLYVAGLTLSYFAGDHATAASVINRSLVLNPNSAHAWSASGQVACNQNRLGPAIEAFQRAMRLSPLDPAGYIFAFGLARAHLSAGQYDDAMEWVDRCLRERPRYILAIRYKVVLCAHLDRIDEAHEWLRRLLALQPGLTITRFKAVATVFMPPETLAIFLEGLRKAGLPAE